MTQDELRAQLYRELFDAMQGLPDWIATPAHLALGARNQALIDAIADFAADTVLQVQTPGVENGDMIADYIAGRIVSRVVRKSCVGAT